MPLGDRDLEAGTVSFRFRDGEQANGLTVDEAIEQVVKAVEDRAQV